MQIARYELVAKASLECYLPHFNLTYCEVREARFVWQFCKRVHSIHYCILVSITIIIYTTLIFAVEWFTDSQYSIKYWSSFFVVPDSLIFVDYLELGSSSEVEDNRRWVSSILTSWLPLCCCVPSNAVLVMNCIHQGNRGTFVIAQPMEVFGIETIFRSLVDLLRFKSFTSKCFNKIFLLLNCCAAYWFHEHFLHAFLNLVNLHNWGRS